MRSLLRRSSYLLYVVPALAVFLLFRHYAIIEGLRMSLIDFNPRGPSEFVGFEHYIRVLQRPRLFESFVRTGYFLVLYLPVSIASSLLVALLIHARGIRGTLFFKVSFFVPVISTFAAMAYVWESILNPDFGPIGALFTALGFEKFFLLGSTTWALPTIVGISVWKNMGFYVIVFSANLEMIDPAYHEAARCDGANAWQQFRYITVPFLHAAFTVSILIGLVDAFQAFTPIFIITAGGPGTSTETIMYYVFNLAYVLSKWEWAAAGSVIVFLVLAAIAAVPGKLLKL